MTKKKKKKEKKRKEKSELHFYFPTFSPLFQLHLWHMEVPRPGNESEPQLQSMPQLQPCQILNLLHHSRNSSTDFCM